MIREQMVGVMIKLQRTWHLLLSGGHGSSYLLRRERQLLRYGVDGSPLL